jgi:hypothetical protein
MDFSQYTLGRVVRQYDPLPLKSRSGISKPCFKGMYGHIIGFDVVEYDDGFDTILLVKWCDGNEFGIHPNAVEVL